MVAVMPLPSPSRSCPFGSGLCGTVSAEPPLPPPRPISKRYTAASAAQDVRPKPLYLRLMGNEHRRKRAATALGRLPASDAVPAKLAGQWFAHVIPPDPPH